MNGDNPVMTEGERRAYRNAKASSPTVRGLGQLVGMRKSWSNDSLSSYGGGGGGGSRSGGDHSCVCAPTTHPGSFRCKHHRHAHASTLGAAPAQAPAHTAFADADAKHHEAQEKAAA